MVKLLRWIASVFAEDLLLKVGGGIVGLASAIALFVFATDGGVPWWIALFYSILTLVLLSVLAFWVSGLSKRHGKPNNPNGSPIQQQQTQQGVVVSPSINIGPFNQSQQQTQFQLPERDKQYVLPEIECPDVYYKDVWLNRWGAILDTHSATEVAGPQRKAAFADIYLKPILESDPHLYLRSEVCFFDATNNSRLRRVKDGIWDYSDTGSEYIRPGETKTIVFVLVVDNKAFATYEHGIMQINRPGRFRSREVLAPISEILPVQNLYAQIRVIGKRGGDLRLNQEFWFHLEGLNGELLIAQVAPPFSIQDV